MNNLTTAKCETCRGFGSVYQENSCGACHGTGIFVPTFEKPCKFCNGKGKTYRTKEGGMVTELCLRCHGTGAHVFRGTERKCLRCFGLGKISRNARCTTCNGTGMKPLNQLAGYWPDSAAYAK